MTESPQKRPEILGMVDELLRLGDPTASQLATMDTDALLAASAKYRRLFLELAKHGRQVEGQGKVTDAEVFSKLLLNVGSFANYATLRLAESKSHDRDLASFSFPEVDSVMRQARELQGELREQDSEPSQLDLAVLAARGLLVDFALYVIALEVLSMSAAWVLSPSLVIRFDAALHGSIQRLASRLGEFPQDGELLVQRIIQAATTQAARLSQEHEDATNAGHRPGSFSLVRPQELALIASRTDAMVARHRPQALEQVFEQQLALIFQSFGYLVIPTRRGKRTADLLCISNDDSDTYSLIVEAKSTKGTYALPTRDERALKEYTSAVRRTMRTLPRPKMMLIVAPKGSTTLEGKLRRLSTDIQLPVRFLPAQVLADLRESAPGAVPSGLLLDALLGQSEMVDSELVDDVAERIQQLNSAHQNLADELGKIWDRHD